MIGPVTHNAEALFAVPNWALAVPFLRVTDSERSIDRDQARCTDQRQLDPRIEKHRKRCVGRSKRDWARGTPTPPQAIP